MRLTETCCVKSGFLTYSLISNTGVYLPNVQKMIVAITNHKGGTGKTTTTANLAAGLAQCGKQVLVVDLDPQANLTYSFGLLDAKHDAVSWMLGRCSFEEVVFKRNDVHLVPSSIAYYDNEEEFRNHSKQNNNRLLRNVLKRDAAAYDYVLIDCPPSLSLLTENALLAAGHVIIPTLFEVLPIVGIEQILEFINSISIKHAHHLNVLGVLGVNVDERRQLTYEVLAYIRDHYQVPVFNNYVRANVKAAEAPSFAKTVLDYAPTSNSARDYQALAKELLGMNRREQSEASAQTV